MVIHRNPIALVALLLGASLAQILPAAETSLPPDLQLKLETLKTSFDSFVLKTVRIPYENKIKELNAQAKATLERVSGTAAQNKDLDALIRIKSDLERIGADKILTASDVPPPASLSQLYAIYKAEFDKIEVARKINASDAKQRYDKSLAALQDEMTTQQDIAAALHVKKLREDLAKTELGTVPSSTLTASSSASPTKIAGTSGSPLPREWTYHVREGLGSSGTMIFEPDGTHLLVFTNMKTPQSGTWKSTAEPGVFSLVFDNVPEVGTTPFKLKITGDQAQMELPNVGTRLLKLKPAAKSSDIIGHWTYHLDPTGEPQGDLHLHSDGQLIQKMKLGKLSNTGSWTLTDKPDVIRFAYENTPSVGAASIEVRLSGDEAEMDLPNLGKRYLKFQSGEAFALPTQTVDTAPKISGLPTEWTYHTSADALATGWLRLLPKGAMEWHDPKGLQKGTWKRTEAGFELDCMNETWTVKITKDWAEVSRPSVAKSYLRLKDSAADG